MRHRSSCAVVITLGAIGMLAGCAPGGEELAARSAPVPVWEKDNPIVPLPASPLGITTRLSDLPDAPTPASVRLGRWLFYDNRLSADATIACASCHRPDYAFSEPTPVSTGIRRQKGGRKAPSFVNQAWTVVPYFFWDGRAQSLEDQALGPMANPIEMGNTHVAILQTLTANGYAPYFRAVFGTYEITNERMAKAIADYERTRLSGNSPWDRWKRGRDERAVADVVKQGDELFFGKAECSQCHRGQNFTDSVFHNLGVGWDSRTRRFKDKGRFAVTKAEADRGAFKTPTLRDVSLHAPYMHDGSVPTLRAVVELYDKGGVRNPHLDRKIRPLRLTDHEIDALVKFMEALTGEGYLDKPPNSFPSATHVQSRKEMTHGSNR
jgi:cytochrome c peroxidase